MAKSDDQKVKASIARHRAKGPVRPDVERVHKAARAKPPLGMGVVNSVSGPVERHKLHIQVPPSDQQMFHDSFNAVHARIALGEGVVPAGHNDPSLVREKIFEIISSCGWEITVGMLASCARLFAEVPGPMPAFKEEYKQILHTLASNLDGATRGLRLVDIAARKKEE